MNWYSSDVAAALAFWGTSLGLFVGIFGFYFTIKQIRQVRSTAEAAEEAIADLKMRFSHFDVIEECTTAENSLSELKEFAKLGDWEKSLSVCDRLATSVINLLERYPFDEQIKIQLVDAKERVTVLSSLSSRHASAAPNAAKDLASLREIHGVLMKVRFKIQEEQ